MPADFTTVTETHDTPASAEQLEMIHTRYAWAAAGATGGAVLEAACGPGRGLGYLARRARRVVGGDFCLPLVCAARAHYGPRIPVLQFDALRLPFPAETFDAVILHEAVYYLPDAGRFVREAARVLRPGGALLLCSANREWPEFNPSPFSIRYYSARELHRLLEDHGLRPDIRAAFEAAPRGPLRRLVSLLRRMAVTFHLVPRTMKGKAFLKRLFYGRLAPLGPEIDDTVPARSPVPVDAHPVTGYKVLYALGRRP